MATKASEYTSLKENAYENMGVYNEVINCISDRAKHGYGTLNLHDLQYLKMFGSSILVKLVAQLKADGFKVIGDPEKVNAHITVCW